MGRIVAATLHHCTCGLRRDARRQTKFLFREIRYFSQPDLVCFVPVKTHTDIDLQRDTQLTSSNHALLYCRSYTFSRIRANLEYQFIVYLHDKTRRGVLALTPRIHGNHRPLDDVGGRTLHWGVDGTALRVLPLRRVARSNIRQVEPAAVDRLDVPNFARAVTGHVHEALYTGVTSEI